MSNFSKQRDCIYTSLIYDCRKKLRSKALNSELALRSSQLFQIRAVETSTANEKLNLRNVVTSVLPLSLESAPSITFVKVFFLYFITKL